MEQNYRKITGEVWNFSFMFLNGYEVNLFFPTTVPSISPQIRNGTNFRTTLPSVFLNN